MEILHDIAELWGIKLASLQASKEDIEKFGVDSDVTYDAVLHSLATARDTDFVNFRNRWQRYDQLKHMLIGLVKKGINLYLGKVALEQGKDFAAMALHIFCYAGSRSFADENLEGRWLTCLESEQFEVAAIRYLPRAKQNTEVTKPVHGQYGPHVRRGMEALRNPPYQGLIALVKKSQEESE